MTFMSGNAIRGAAERALAAWTAEERPAIAIYQYRPPRPRCMIRHTGRSEPNFAYGYVAQAVEVEVDIDLGFVRVLRVVSADDVGKAINPRMVQGQIEGAVVQALGYAVMEHLISEKGASAIRTSRPTPSRRRPYPDRGEVGHSEHPIRSGHMARGAWRRCLSSRWSNT
jgi:CO/xanthine dehydrogenase Mo-binding subunit